jgi:hypothetical protein
MRCCLHRWASAEVLLERFGFTPEAVAARAAALVERTTKEERQG